MSSAASHPGSSPVRAGILVTGTEVLTGIISDRNGPWLSERLAELGVDAAMIQIVGDRADDLMAALRFMAAEGMAVVVTSGGLGPTADDLTAEIVGRFAGREMVLDAELEARIAEILRPLMSRWPGLDADAVRSANRKQAVIPAGATVLDPVGTAPGLVVPPRDGTGPTVVVLPGPPRELHEMWEKAVATDAFRSAIAGAPVYRRGIVRLYGIPESEIANTLRAAADAGLPLEPLEITTCLRRGEIEVATRYEASAESDYEAFVEFLAERHRDQLFSRDGSTVDEQVASALIARDRTVAVAESCTGGLMSARLTERAGSSAYFLGGAVVYSDAAKVSTAGVDPDLIARHGAVSNEVAEALASGAAARFGADIGIGITGIAGPGGGTEEKPVGTVCFSVCSGAGGSGAGASGGPDSGGSDAGRSDASGASGVGARLTRRMHLPGSRSDIRERSTTVVMHLLRRVLVGDGVQVSSASEAGSLDAQA